MGDSLTYGYPNSYNRYERTLLGLLGGSPWEVHNAGVGLNTTTQMLARYQADVLSHDPDWVIVWGGINDIGQGYSADTIESNLQSLYTQGHNIGAKIVAINISEYGAATTSEQAEIQDVNYWIAHSAKDIDYRVDAYSQLEDPTDPNHLLYAYDSGDHLHLSDAGYDAVASGVYRVIKPKGGLPVWVWIIVGVSAATGASLLAYHVHRKLATRKNPQRSCKRPKKNRRRRKHR